jgi:putative transcriptional regulator
MLISRIGDLIKEKGFRPGWIAEYLGVSRHTVTNWSKGRVKIPIEKAFELSRLFGVTVEDLYLYVDKNTGKYKTFNKKSGKMYIIEFKNGQATAAYFDKNDVFHERKIEEEHLRNYEFIKEIRR